MGFLAALAAKMLQWILEKGGKALYEAVTEFVERKRQEEANKKNTKKHEEDIATNAPPEQKGRSGADLINGKR